MTGQPRRTTNGPDPPRGSVHSMGDVGADQPCEIPFRVKHDNGGKADRARADRRYCDKSAERHPSMTVNK